MVFLCSKVAKSCIHFAVLTWFNISPISDIVLEIQKGLFNHGSDRKYSFCLWKWCFKCSDMPKSVCTVSTREFFWAFSVLSNVVEKIPKRTTWKLAKHFSTSYTSILKRLTEHRNVFGLNGSLIIWLLLSFIKDLLSARHWRVDLLRVESLLSVPWPSPYIIHD